MLRSLFLIPDEIGGVPVFGVGLLLGAWSVFAVVLLVVMARRHGWGTETTSYLPVLALIGGAIVFVLPMLTEGSVEIHDDHGHVAARIPLAKSADPEIAAAAAQENAARFARQLALTTKEEYTLQTRRGLPVRGYGMMMLAGVVAAVLLGAALGRRAGIDTEQLYSMAIWMFMAGIVGARSFHVVEYWDASYRKFNVAGDAGSGIDWSATLGNVVNIPGGGLVVYGSLVGILAVLFWFIRVRKLPGLVILDLVAPSLMLGLAFGRAGCLLNGCCFGGVCELPWAVTYPPQSPPYERQVEGGANYGVQTGGPTKAPRVTWVAPDSPAAAAGLQAGQPILQIGGAVAPNLPRVRKEFAILAETEGVLEIALADGDKRRTAKLAWSPPRPRSLAVHPTQIYSSINSVLLSVFLLAFYPFRRHNGEVFAMLITVYPVSRFFLEAIRTDESGMFGTQFSISQLVSFGLLAVAAATWMALSSRPPLRVTGDQARV